MALISLTLCGCHVYIPTTTLDGNVFSGVKTTNTKIILVIDETYNQFTSYDRGHWLADPQKYILGPALEELTLAYFRQAFSVQSVLGSRPATSQPIPLIELRVPLFRQDLGLTSAIRRLTLELEAVLVDPITNQDRRSFRASATTEHFIDTLGRNNQAITNEVLGETIQKALAGLIHRVQSGIAPVVTPAN